MDEYGVIELDNGYLSVPGVIFWVTLFLLIGWLTGKTFGRSYIKLTFVVIGSLLFIWGLLSMGMWPYAAF